MRADLEATREALRRTFIARHRLEAQQSRSDTRAWVMQRRERTRHLIELGGLVQKAGLVELTADDRAALYGAFLMAAGTLKANDGAETLALLRRMGQRAFAREDPPRQT